MHRTERRMPKRLAEQAEIVQGLYRAAVVFKSKIAAPRDVTETHVQAVRELLHQGTGKSISRCRMGSGENIYGFL